MTQQSNQVLNIADLDLRSPSNEGAEVEITRPDGSGTGVYIRVLGEQSETVERFIVRKADERAARIVEARLRDKSAGDTGLVSARVVLDDEIESATVRTAGWRGLSEPYTEDNARKLFTLNRLIARQVIAASQDEALFMKA
ncbi:hypothetical protein [Bordetella sp. LUAb4]|uniref:hypothetical protein n=1 Tax=Bordetella sp. LUAb4 TaxID=2843195 RepID=UPI001E65967C|nr:hypothetical protein [Bordetella sp. LUAb4]